MFDEGDDLLSAFPPCFGFEQVPACAGGVLGKRAALLGVQLRHALLTAALSKCCCVRVFEVFWLVLWLVFFLPTIPFVACFLQYIPSAWHGQAPTKLLSSGAAARRVGRRLPYLVLGIGVSVELELREHIDHFPAPG